LSLILAIFSLITAAQHSAIIHTLISPPKESVDSTEQANRIRPLVTKGVSKAVPKTESMSEDENDSHGEKVEKTSAGANPTPETSSKHRPSKNMMYIWQTPTMLMSWSWIMFMLGLILHATVPLRTDYECGNTRKSAIFFLATGTVVVLNFGWCSLWMYLAASKGVASKRASCLVDISQVC
jgi:hypothetical protein